MRPVKLTCVFWMSVCAVVGANAGGGDDEIRLPPMEVTVDSDPFEKAAVRALNDAESDIRAGVLRIRRGGHPSFVTSDATDRLKERYRIEIVGEGCVTTEVSRIADAVYNAVMQRAILQRFGKSFRQLEVELESEPNQALQPTPMLVTPRADARVAPSTGVADL